MPAQGDLDGCAQGEPPPFPRGLMSAPRHVLPWPAPMTMWCRGEEGHHMVAHHAGRMPLAPCWCRSPIWIDSTRWLWRRRRWVTWIGLCSAPFWRGTAAGLVATSPAAHSCAGPAWATWTVAFPGARLRALPVRYCHVSTSEQTTSTGCWNRRAAPGAGPYRGVAPPAPGQGLCAPLTYGQSARRLFRPVAAMSGSSNRREAVVVASQGC